MGGASDYPTTKLLHRHDSGGFSVIAAGAVDPVIEPAVRLAAANAFWLYWMAGLTSEIAPRFEYRITPRGEWSTPRTTADYGVIVEGPDVALRPSAELAGWGLWQGARRASALLGTVPEGSTIDVAMAPPAGSRKIVDPEIGRTMYRGVIRNRRLELNHASPAIDRATLIDALEFAGMLVTTEQILVRGDEEHEVFKQNVTIYASGDDTQLWDGDAVRIVDLDLRSTVMLAQPVFRKRFGGQWKCD